MLSRIKGELIKVKNGLINAKRRVEKISAAGIGARANWAGAPASVQREFFAGLSAAKQREFFETNGFLWVPNAMSTTELAQVHSDVRKYGFTGTTEDLWAAPSFPPLIENDKVLSALQAILGDDIRFFKAAYVGTPPVKTAGMKPERKTLHVDYGIGETIEDWRNSCALWINVGFYLTDLSAEHAPFWVVPGSNRYYHVPPWTDMEYLGHEAEMVLAKAGDALLFHCLTIHATAANVSNEVRQAIFYSYRPAWARHIGIVKEWPEEFVASAPEQRKNLLLGLNGGSARPRNTI